MKVLQICPLWCPIARDAAGGRETLLARLVEALEARGVHNTVLATGDSRTSGELIEVCPTNLWSMMDQKRAYEYSYYEQHQIILALPRLHEFDIVHSHVGNTAFFLSGLAGMKDRVLHTVHTPMYGDLQWFVSQHPDYLYSTVSEFQAERLRKHGARRCSAIYNGIDVESFTFQPAAGEGLFFIGRIEHGKGPDVAVKVAVELKMPLKIAGPILDQGYFDQTIKPYLGRDIQYVGVVSHEQKNELFGKAACTVLPFRHEESFGMVMVEAMACGSPVVALANGAVPEIVEDGLTGYRTNDETQIAKLIPAAMRLDRKAIRQRVAERFDISTVARQYHELYQQIGASHAV